jgi:drug/metabolite transporter (DMT)-like permease
MKEEQTLEAIKGEKRRPRLLGIFGLFALLIGAYLLSDPQVGTNDVINFHKLVIGMTATICGAIFVAAQWHR